ncbi:MarR family transcriptional regulator, partial [Neorhizobium sp. BETTINA12A]|nr:MarR family transcriptional regulator [Neorhizobium sp. BETTINA12A]
MDSLGFLIADSARLLRAAFERRIAEAGLGLTPGEA